jgi:hypothetical protein
MSYSAVAAVAAAAVAAAAVKRAERGGLTCIICTSTVAYNCSALAMGRQHTITHISKELLSVQSVPSRYHLPCREQQVLALSSSTVCIHIRGEHSENSSEH